jgi:hypothetical protein
MLTRRTAIAATLLAFVGTPVFASTQEPEKLSSDPSLSITTTPYIITPSEPAALGLSVSLDTITFLDVTLNKETVRISAAEIWQALQPVIQATPVPASAWPAGWSTTEQN